MELISFAFLILFDKSGVISVTYPGHEPGKTVTLQGCMEHKAWALDTVRKNNVEYLKDYKIIFAGCVDESLVKDIQAINDARADIWADDNFSFQGTSSSGSFSNGAGGLDECLDMMTGWKENPMVDTPIEDFTGLWCSTPNTMYRIIEEMYDEKRTQHLKALKSKK